MDNREAITLLRNLEDSLDAYCELNEEGKTAFRMAIEALNCSEFPNNSDTISRQAAIDAIKKNTFRLTFAEEQNCEGHVAWSAEAVYSDVMEGALLELPSAQPEAKEIRYAECANAMLKMWMDNVLTDGEYNRIMDRLNAHHNAGRRRAESEEV